MSGSPSQPCPDHEMLEAVAGGATPLPAIAAHLDTCADCRGEVESMRAALALLGEAVDVAATRSHDPEDRVPGYRLVRELHRGGQGVVWLAEQEGTKRTVAIKMPLLGRAATSEQRRRFDREVEVVASLRDPAIVTIFERGTTLDGEPYYAMEYVEGRRFDAWIAETHPTVRTSVAMVARIAEAVGTAHRRGVIHRDLKPGNILVDPEGVPRVLDFGLARLETHRDPEAGLDEATMEGAFLGNFAYAAPEQLSESPQAVDTSADVYALGLLLHEAITGRPAFPKPKSLMDLVGQRVGRTPPRPSSLAPGIGTELDLIVLRAVDPEPERRYATAGEFAEDLRRLLDGRPVLARGDGLGYVLWKLARRHALPASIAATSLVVIVTALVALAFLYRESERGRTRAESMAKAYESAFLFLDPQEDGAMDLRAPDLIGRLVEISDQALATEPHDRAKVLLLAGNGYVNLERVPEAEACYRRAHDLETESDDPDRARLAAIEHGLGRVAYFRGRSANRQAESAARAGRPEDAVAARAMADADLAEAIEWYSSAVSRLKEIGGEAESVDLAMSLQHLAGTRLEALVGGGRTADPEALAEVERDMFEVLEVRRVTHPDDPLMLAITWNSIAVVREKRNDLDGAIEAADRVVALLPDDDGSSWAGRARVALGSRLLKSGRPSEAIDPLGAGIEICTRIYGAASPITQRANERLVEALLGAGRHAEALRRLDLMRAESATDGAESPDLVVLRVDALVGLGRRDEAVAVIDEARRNVAGGPFDLRLQDRDRLLAGRTIPDDARDRILDRWGTGAASD